MTPSSADVGVRLAIGADPMEDESLPGFLMRLAHGVRFRSATRLAAIAGLRQPGSAVASTVDLGPLARLAGTEIRLLDAIRYPPTARTGFHRFLGGTVNRELIRLDLRRWCPACLSSSTYHRAAWDFALQTACPDHGLGLLDRCPGCGRQQRWELSDLMRCRCGADLRCAPAMAIGSAERMVARRLSELGRGTPPSWLATAPASCDPADLPWLLMCLGMSLTGWTRQRRIETLVSCGPDEVARVVSAGVAALEDWPGVIHRFLTEQGDGASARNGRYGARKSLGAFYRWLTLMPDGVPKRVLAKAASEFVAADPHLSRRSHRSRLVGARSTSGEMLGLKETADRLGVATARVKRLMADGSLPAAASAGRGVPMLIGRAAVESLAASQAGSLDLEQAAALLDISRTRVRCLVEAGVLQSASRAGAAGKSSRRLVASDVEALPGRLAGTIGRPADGRTVGFNHVAEVLRRQGVGFAEAVAMIGERRLQVVTVDEKAVGLKRLRFAPEAVATLRRSFETGDALTVEAAALHLGCKWQVVANLVARGLLPADGSGRVRPDALERFSAAYVTGADLARTRGTSPRSLAERLAADGVVPVVGPRVDGSRQNIYRRSDMEKSA